MSAIPSDELPNPHLPGRKMTRATDIAAVLWVLGWGGAVADSFWPPLPDAAIEGAFAVAMVVSLTVVGQRLAYARREEHDLLLGEISRTQATVTKALSDLACGLLMRERAQRETMRRLLVDPEHGARMDVLERSEYWEVYADVLRDLGGLALPGLDDDDRPPE